MAWALIINGTVHQVSVSDPTDNFPADMNWQVCPNGTAQDWTATQSKGVWSFAAPVVAVPTLADAQAAQYAAIIGSAQSALAAVVAGYPDLEVATWPQQYAEAMAYIASNTAPTPMLAAISTSSGLTVADLAANVMAKAAAYQAASGAVVGKRVALMATIAAATTVSAVQAVVWA